MIPTNSTKMSSEVSSITRSTGVNNGTTQDQDDNWSVVSNNKKTNNNVSKAENSTNKPYNHNNRGNTNGYYNTNSNGEEENTRPFSA